MCVRVCVCACVWCVGGGEWHTHRHIPILFRKPRAITDGLCSTAATISRTCTSVKLASDMNDHRVVIGAMFSVRTRIFFKERNKTERDGMGWFEQLPISICACVCESPPFTREKRVDRVFRCCFARASVATYDGGVGSF